MRLIDADALMEQHVWLCGGWVGDSHAEGYMDALDKVEETIKSAPTIDAVPVVRCADCKCWTEWSNGTGSCSRFALDWIGTDADDFCSFAERKDNEIIRR